MIEKYIFLGAFFFGGAVCANTTCDSIPGEQGYPPLHSKNATVCFIQEPVLDPTSGARVGADSISIYYVESGGVPVKAEGRGLLYDDTPAKITDAFLMNVDRKKKVFIINYVEVRSSLVEPNSSGKFYSVDVFDMVGDGLRRDERASEWFGSSYSLLSDNAGMLYRFPYLSRKDVQRALDSPFFSLASRESNVPVKVKFKSRLFGWSSIRNKTKKYVNKGKRTTVNEVTAGWCRITYSEGGRPIEMWLMCSALEVEAKQRKAS